MSDSDEFIDAFNRGQVAVQAANRAKSEIEGVIREFTEKLRIVSDGRLEAEIKEFTNNALGILDLSRVISDSITQNLPSSRDQKREWIAVRNPKVANSSWQRIAEWQRPYEGYPCVIRYESEERRCHDKDALREALVGMLENAWVAGNLRAVMSRSNNDPPSK
jgi:hypothetical protein